MLREMQHRMVTSWLDVARVPADLVTRAVPNGSEGPRARVQIVVDQVDAAARTVLGGLLDDEELQADGARRRVAATERLAAMRRRDVPDARRAKTDRRVAEARTKAKEHRGQAQSVAKAAIDEVAQRAHPQKAGVAAEPAELQVGAEL